MNEEETKLELITPALQQVGWGKVEGSRIRMEYPITNKDKPGVRNYSQLSADYVLFYKNRRLAVVEAKAKNKYYTEGLPQAKDYAERLNIRFSYATNGLDIYAVDMLQGKEGDVTSYPCPDELWEMCFPAKQLVERTKQGDVLSGEGAINWHERLFERPFEDQGGKWQPRYYQENAINHVLEGIAAGKQRMLLTLATGTGKTAIAFQIAWKLFHAKWNLKRDASRLPRILFLADRNILADQAFNSFGAFEEEALIRIAPSEIKKKGQVPKNGSIFFTIFQTFMSGPDDTPYFGQYPADFFDFIIIDECHRGGANDESSWRVIMDYFSPAVQLGLTATPKRDVNGDTYKYFGEPIYTYSLKEGINDGFLTPFRVKEISTTVDDYTYTNDDKVIQGVATIGRKYKESEFNRVIKIKQREAFRVKRFMDLINQKQKTLVFCATQIHAAAVRDLINQYTKSSNANYCHRVTADDGSRGEVHLRDFQDNEKSVPTILTTSQKLSTGVDAPEIRNIVLLRPVNSMVEFKQIVGRGTRLYDNKDYFTVFDFVKAHAHFQDEEWDGPPLEPEPPINRPEPQPCQECGEKPCVCETTGGNDYCDECGNDPCVCEHEPAQMVEIVLSDNTIRQIDSMVKTTFWHSSGKPMSQVEFMNELFGDLPKICKDEDALRKVWCLPGTRNKLLKELADKGYSEEQLEGLRKLVQGEDSDLFDVLSYVAYHKNMVPRLERAERAMLYFDSYNKNQQAFLNFVLEQYVKQGVSELDDAKLPDLLTLKYDAIADAKVQLGDTSSIRETFIGFQRYLYERRAS